MAVAVVDYGCDSPRCIRPSQIINMGKASKRLQAKNIYLNDLKMALDKEVGAKASGHELMVRARFCLPYTRTMHGRTECSDVLWLRLHAD